MPEKELCQGCQKHVMHSRWQIGLMLTIIISLAGVFFQAQDNVAHQLQEHEALPWHAGAGEAHSHTRAQLEGLKTQTADRFRRREWEAWVKGNAQRLNDMQRLVILLEESLLK